MAASFGNTTTDTDHYPGYVPRSNFPGNLICYTSRVILGYSTYSLICYWCRNLSRDVESCQYLTNKPYVPGGSVLGQSQFTFFLYVIIL
jgi:hypothetical protein